MVHTDNTKNKQSLKKQALIELALLFKSHNTVKERREGGTEERRKGEKKGGREQGTEEGRRMGGERERKKKTMTVNK